MRPAVFLDRDGVLVENINGDYIREKSQIKVLPFAKQAVAKLHEHGFMIVIVTNQACVSKGLISADQANVIQKEIEHRLDPTQTMQIKSKLCPHASHEECNCRKPQPGMILSSIDEYRLNLSKSYMIGDALSDMQAAIAAGMRPIFVLSGRGKVSDLGEIGDIAQSFDHVGSAVDYICGNVQ